MKAILEIAQMQTRMYYGNMTLAERLTAFRVEAGLQQKELAEKSKVSEATISRIEAGVITKPRINMLVAISGVLGITVSDLIGDKPAQERIEALPGDELIRRLARYHDGANADPTQFAQLVESYHQVSLEEREDIAEIAKWKADRRHRNESKDEVERG